VKLVVGLGNPGRRYAATRHNVGFRIVDHWAEAAGITLDEERYSGRFGCGGLAQVEVALLQPLTYMNRSGTSVAAAVDDLVIADVSRDLLVAYDDVDLPFGQLRIRPSGGPGGHRGLEDIIEQLGQRDFPRLRFGIGHPPLNLSTTDYVLETFSTQEQEVLGAHLEQASEAITCILVHGLSVSMNRYNAAPATKE
jgi:PTH1 family peptidyl-tRNA hydrolase